MTFAAEIARSTSHRHLLVRLTPARYVSESLASIGGGVYEMTFPYPPARVTRNTGTCTKVDTIVAINQWTYNETTQLLQVRLAGAPTDTNVVLVHYYLFFSSASGGDDQVAYETPTDSATALRLWKPSIVGEPEIQQTLSDVFYGVFSIAASNLAIANADDSFQAYLSDDDSFNEKPIDIWIVVNEQIQKVYTGKVKTITIDEDAVSIGMLDGFARLNQPAYFGDELEEAFYLRDSSTFPDLDPAMHFTAIPFVFGRNPAPTEYVTIGRTGPWRDITDSGPASQGYNYLFFLSPTQTIGQAVCVDYDPNIGSTKNREWGLARTADAFLTLDIGSPVGGLIHLDAKDSPTNTGDRWMQNTDSSSDRTHWYMTYSGAIDANLLPGDSLKYVNGGTTYYLLVTDVGANDPLEIGGFISNRIPSSTTSTIATSHLVSTIAPALVIVDGTTGDAHLPVYGHDFTYVSSTTNGNNEMMTVTFVNGFETAQTGGQDNHSGLTTLDPRTHQIFFRVRQSESNDASRHDQVLQKILESADLTVDATTFAAFAALLTAKCVFTVPNLDEDEPGPYIQYAQALLKSTLGYVQINATDGEVEYARAAAPSSSTEITDDLRIGVSPPAITIDYRDIVTSITASNRHYPDGPSLPLEESVKAAMLHGVEQKVIYEHVLETLEDVIGPLLDVLSERRATYAWTVATKLLDAGLGDDRLLVSGGDYLLGQVASRAVKITSLTKGPHGVLVEATDLLGGA